MVDFHRLIAKWFRLNSRSLPWRETNNPYFIWLSEIILQQTRVDQGLSYYNKLTRNFPTVDALANASEEDVLNNWQGLGYYSRARNLHFAAKTIVNKHHSIFPSSYNEIKNLKGIGDYTAAAIASFAFNLPHAVVDGNVYRVLSRVFDVSTPIDSTEGKKQFAALAQELMPVKSNAEHNQAIMEFGALQCVPKNPSCESCPLNNICLAYANQTIQLRPLKTKKVKISNRFLYYLIFEKENKIAIEKRTKEGIWKHLYQFPVIETEEQLSEINIKKRIQEEFQQQIFEISPEFKHLLSHQKIKAHFIIIKNTLPENKSNLEIISLENFQDFPVPKLIENGFEWYLTKTSKQ